MILEATGVRIYMLHLSRGRIHGLYHNCITTCAKYKPITNIGNCPAVCITLQ